MKATELRIDNYVNHMNNTYQILGLDECEKINRLSRKWLGNELHACNIPCKPIPLTEEWLVKFGFEKKKAKWGTMSDMINVWANFSFCISIWNSGALMYEYNGGNIELKSVHQLQNLYFALTNKELTLK